MNMRGWFVLVALCVVSFINAQDHEDSKSPFRTGHHEVHQMNLELFLGTTMKKGVGLPTIGIDYEHRLNAEGNKFGLGFLIDYEVGKENLSSEVLITPTSFYFPNPHLKLFFGAGVASHKYHGNELGHSTIETDLLLRTGLGYEWDVTEVFVMSPSMYVDYHGQGYFAYVFGMAFGVGR